MLLCCNRSISRIVGRSLYFVVFFPDCILLLPPGPFLPIIPRTSRLISRIAFDFLLFAIRYSPAAQLQGIGYEANLAPPLDWSWLQHQLQQQFRQQHAGGVGGVVLPTHLCQPQDLLLAAENSRGSSFSSSSTLPSSSSSASQDIQMMNTSATTTAEMIPGAGVVYVWLAPGVYGAWVLRAGAGQLELLQGARGYILTTLPPLQSSPTSPPSASSSSVFSAGLVAEEVISCARLELSEVAQDQQQQEEDELRRADLLASMFAELASTTTSTANATAAINKNTLSGAPAGGAGFRRVVSRFVRTALAQATVSFVSFEVCCSCRRRYCLAVSLCFSLCC